MPRIVDGNNLLWTWPGRGRSEEDRRALAHLVHRSARARGRRVVVFFDGPSPSSLPAPDVHYSGAGRSADDAILSFLESQRNPRGWILVTDDRSLADRARARGARVESCARFRESLETEGAEEKPGSVDLDYWTRAFSERKDDGEDDGEDDLS